MKDCQNVPLSHSIFRVLLPVISFPPVTSRFKHLYPVVSSTCTQSFQALVPSRFKHLYPVVSSTCTQSFQALVRSCVTNLDFYHYVYTECDCSRTVDVIFLDFVKSLTKGSLGRFSPWASMQCCYQDRKLHGWQEGGRGSLSMMCPLTRPLFTVLIPKVQFCSPSFLSSISMTWTSASPARCISSLTIPSWGLMLLIRNLWGTLENGPWSGRCPLTWISAMSCT